MAGQPEIDAVPDAGELRVVVRLLGVQRDARQEAERFAEVYEPEAPDQCLPAILQRPSLRNIHCESPVLQAGSSRKSSFVASGAIQMLAKSPASLRTFGTFAPLKCPAHPGRWAAKELENGHDRGGKDRHRVRQPDGDRRLRV